MKPVSELRRRAVNKIAGKRDHDDEQHGKRHAGDTTTSCSRFTDAYGNDLCRALCCGEERCNASAQRAPAGDDFHLMRGALFCLAA